LERVRDLSESPKPSRKSPGLGEAFKLLTQVLPLGRGAVVERNGKIYVA
jgi:hypothetical protein